MRVVLPGPSLVCVVGVTVCVLSPGVVEAEQDPITVWDGVYTAEQASRGETVYQQHCLSCHRADLGGSEEASALVGDPFMQAWREDTVGTLFTRIRNLMPFDEPATLSAADYLDSVAYLLQRNGFPAGDTELVTDHVGEIRIENEDGPGEVPSFALVRVLGCLTDGGDRWRLTHSTRAVRTDDPSVSRDAVLTQLAGASLGAQTFDLMAVYPDPTDHVGHRVEAKGFLIRSPDGDRINVSTLQMVSDTCGS